MSVKSNKEKMRIKYVYIEPKSTEEKKEQQQMIDDVFDMIFDEAFKK